MRAKLGRNIDRWSGPWDSLDLDDVAHDSDPACGLSLTSLTYLFALTWALSRYKK